MAMGDDMEKALAPLFSAPVEREHNPAFAYLASLGKGSRRTMFEALAVIVYTVSKGQTRDVSALNWSALRRVHVDLIRSELQERYSPATANKTLSALRGALKEAFLMGQLPPEEYLRLKEINPVRGTSAPAGRALSSDELEKLFDACRRDKTLAGMRDGAILAVLRVGGLRRSELSALDIQDYDPAAGSLTIRKGKGNKPRVVYIANGATHWLADWLALRGDEPGALFWSMTPHGEVVEGHRLTAQGVFYAIQRRADQAGIPPISPHDLRRTFVSDLLSNGVDIVTVQKLAGHANVTTTAKYDRRGDAVQLEAVKTLRVPRPF